MNQNLQAIRGLLGLTRKEFAKILGVHHNTIRNWEANIAQVRLSQEGVDRLIMMGVNMEFIYLGTGPILRESYSYAIERARSYCNER